MPLEVQQRKLDGVTILDFDGRMIAGEEVTSARNSFNDAAASGDKNLIVNLQKVAYIDSTGLGTLVVGHSSMQKAEGAMKLLHLSERHLQLMVISKLTTVFEIFDDEQAAINSFYPDRGVKHFDILEFVKSQEGDTEHLGADATAPSEPSDA